MEPPGRTGKIRCPLAFLVVVNCPNCLSRCSNPLQNGQRSVFTCSLKSFATQTFGVPIIANSPLTSGFFQKIASTHHTSLMLLAWRIPKWKMAQKVTYKDDTYQVQAFVTKTPWQLLTSPRACSIIGINRIKTLFNLIGHNSCQVRRKTQLSYISRPSHHF